MKSIAKCGRGKSGFELIEALEVFGPMFKHARTLVAQKGFNLAELNRLEAAAGLQSFAERIERPGGHRFQDVELSNQGFQNGAAATKSGVRAPLRTSEEIRFDFFQFVQEQFEPEFVDLMDDNKKHFIVLRRITSDVLQIQQLVQLKIARVGQIRHGVRILPAQAETLETLQELVLAFAMAQCVSVGLIGKGHSVVEGREHLGDPSSQLSLECFAIQKHRVADVVPHLHKVHQGHFCDGVGIGLAFLEQDLRQVVDSCGVQFIQAPHIFKSSIHALSVKRDNGVCGVSNQDGVPVMPLIHSKCSQEPNRVA